jgi:16S rRNA (cytosine1402-N4)-methyltransferase
MEELEQFLTRTPATLSLGGRWVVLAYHSLEDRQVKHRFQQLAREAAFRMLTKKPVVASDAEVQMNPRARSAKMRVVEKIGVEKSAGEKIGGEKIELERAS